MTPDPSENRLVLRKLLPATREEVFDAWLDPVGMREWMPPGTGTSATAEIDPRVGGKFRIVMHHPERDYDHRGEYRVIDRPSKLVFTWISEGTEQRESLVTIELHERGRETELVLMHEKLPNAVSVERHTGGWAGILEKIGARFRK